MSYQLVNFNIPTGLKDSLDHIAKAKRLSRTAIINQLLETYCRAELQQIASQPLPLRKKASNSRADHDDGMPLVPFLVSHDRFDGGWSL
jgi:predicted transcriptional regulator